MSNVVPVTISLRRSVKCVKHNVSVVATVMDTVVFPTGIPYPCR